MGGSVKERNYCLDFIKLMACIFIVLRHVIILGEVGETIANLTKCFVPFFFMVSGYYCFRGEGLETKNIKPKIFHILKITIVTYVFYIIVSLFFIYRYGEESLLKLNGVPVAILKMVVFNQPMFIPEFVWFLLAMIYVYIIYAIIQKFNLYSLAYILIPILFFVFVALAYVGLIFNFEVPNYFYRNFLFEGLPFFMLGHFIHKNQNKINVSNFWLCVILVVSTALVLVETCLMGINLDLHITNAIQIVAIFLLAVKNPNIGKGVLANLGRDLSMYVYIVHIAVRKVVWAVYSMLGWESDFHWSIMPILVIVCSLAVSFVLFHIVKFVGEKRRKTA